MKGRTVEGGGWIGRDQKVAISIWRVARAPFRVRLLLLLKSLYSIQLEHLNIFKITIIHAVPFFVPDQCPRFPYVHNTELGSPLPLGKQCLTPETMLQRKRKS